MKIWSHTDGMAPMDGYLAPSVIVLIAAADSTLSIATS